uniref:GOLD domain-containing protein n=1 Tax=Proboscia inermis TaxID=420281 RepID=A0A7S0CL17_9STRA|mmetsp:Transcript_584/g.627  ORF Transcript_584/g.627 Transcript_584/m.627 type:complete len:201 (+) Transcript_584:256-858(+)
MNSGNFDFVDDHLNPAPLSVTLFKYPKMEVVWMSDLQSTEGIFSFVDVQEPQKQATFNPKHGATKTVVSYGSRYKLCVSNGDDDIVDDVRSDGLPRTVGFSVRVVPLGEAYDSLRPDDEPEISEKQEEMYEMTANLMNRMDTLVDHQSYMKVRENKHRTILEATFGRLVKWTIFEATMLITIACAQVYYIKHFFEQRSRL